ncbi:MAG: ABC transporter permease [Prevotella sp.]|nr:ABC transporter permease [Prevotella sp.]
MSLPLFISRRIYAGNNDGRKVSRPAVRIAVAGVAIGLAVMIISVSVVIGFKRSIREKVTGFGGSIQVANYRTLQSSEFLPVCVGDSMLDVLRNIDGVTHAERFCTAQGMLKTDDDFLGVTFKGVAEEWDSTFIHDNLKAGSIPVFSADTSSNNIVISRSIAKKLRLEAGQRVFAYFFDGDGVRMRRFTVAGIYETNLSQYDDVMCFTDLHTTVRLNGWTGEEALGAELSVSDFSMLDRIEDNVVARVNRTTDSEGRTFSSLTIKELNPQIFAWLDLLDMNVWVILALMLLVASVTIISGLLIIILERTAMIGILKALGARNIIIRRTFLWFGLFITSKGMLIGDIIAIAILLLQRFTGFIRLDPATYYVSAVPVDFNIPLFLALNIATLVVSLLVLLLPSLIIAGIRPAKAMRFD